MIAACRWPQVAAAPAARGEIAVTQTSLGVRGAAASPALALSRPWITPIILARMTEGDQEAPTSSAIAQRAEYFDQEGLLSIKTPRTAPRVVAAAAARKAVSTKGATAARAPP